MPGRKRGARDLQPRKLRGMKASRLNEVAAGRKVCKRCGQEKALDDFPLVTNRNASKSWTYPRPECQDCHNALKADRFQRMKDAYRPTRERYYAAHLEQQAWWRSIKRARKAGATRFLSLDEWKALRNVRNCHWCGLELHPSFRHMDHVQPLSQGGQHSADNLVAGVGAENALQGQLHGGLMEFVDTTQVDHTPVTLADRAGEARFEFTFDGRTWVKPQGKTTWNLPAYVATWLLKGDRCKVWTTEGEFTHRFGLSEPTDELVGKLGHAVMVTDPITIDTSAIEGWDTRGAERTGPGTQIRLQGAALREAKMAQRERLGGAARPAFAP